MRYSYKDLVNALNISPGFTNLNLYENSAPITINCYKDNANIYNEFWTEFNTKQLVNKVSDGLPRYVYFGEMTLGTADFIEFSYRGSKVVFNSNTNFNVTSNALFDSCTLGVGAEQFWSFTGFIIDRGA